LGAIRHGRPVLKAGERRHLSRVSDLRCRTRRRMKMESQKVADVIETAIRREEEAYVFYMDIFSRVKDASVKETLHYIAAEEKKHREFLVRYRDGGFGVHALRMNDVVDYKVAEHLQEPEIDKNLRSQDVYLIAAHREKRSYLFYMDLAGLHREGDLNEMLVKIASEELKHKEKMEYLYANTAFPQTDGG
jgi:rubrerythrin